MARILKVSDLRPGMVVKYRKRVQEPQPPRRKYVVITWRQIFWNMGEGKRKSRAASGFSVPIAPMKRNGEVVYDEAVSATPYFLEKVEEK